MLRGTSVFNAEEPTRRASIQLQLHRHPCVTRLYRQLRTTASVRIESPLLFDLYNCFKNVAEGPQTTSQGLLIAS